MEKRLEGKEGLKRPETEVKKKADEKGTLVILIVNNNNK